MCSIYILNNQIPYKTIELATGECKTHNFIGEWSSDKAKTGEVQIGFYAVYATGSYYLFYDGVRCWNDRNDWGEPSTKYWKETHGIPPCFNQYSFEYKSNNHSSSL